MEEDEGSRERGGEEFNLKIGISMGKGFAERGKGESVGRGVTIRWVGAAGEMKKVERRGESSTKRKLKFSGRTHSSLLSQSLMMWSSNACIKSKQRLMLL